MQRRGPTRPVADGDEVRAVDLGDRERRLAIEDPEPGRLVGQPGQALELGQRDPAQVRGWLEAFASSERATVEQVVLVPCGAVDVEPAA